MSLVNPLINRSAKNLAVNTISPKVSQVQHSMFVVPIKIGSQQYDAYMLLHTGTTSTWVKCHGCFRCFKLRGPPIDPRNSSSYRPLPFDSPLCRKSFRKAQDKCGFNATYPSGSVIGIASLENNVFTATTGPPVTVPDVVLGCASSAPKTFFDDDDNPNNPIAGTLGLSLGPYLDSFMARTPNITKLKFSYCLPPWDKTHIQTSMLFGDDVKPLPRSAPSTPLQTWQSYINCKDISVAGKRLNLDPALFRLRRDGSGGFIKDTGTCYTYLVAPAYNKIKATFVKALRSYMKPIPPVKPYDLCYSWPFPQIPHLPSLTYHLHNATLEVDFWNVFQIIELSGARKVVCLMMFSVEIGSMNHLGVVNQANYRFVYNLKTQTFKFLSGKVEWKLVPEYSLVANI